MIKPITYTTTAEIVLVRDNGGMANCATCGGSCLFTYAVTALDGRGYNFCSLCVPNIGDFAHIAVK